MLLSIASCLVIFLLCVGCDNSSHLDSQVSKSTTPISEAAQVPAAESQSQKPKVAPPQTSNDPPLDESVHVDQLLSMRLTEAELRDGWIRLFDGQSLMGWHNAGDADWRVEDGVIMATHGESCLLTTQVRFSDYEIELEFLAGERTNSGIFLRTPAKPTDPQKDCYELNIAPWDNPFPTGSLVGRVKKNEQVDEPEPMEWHRLHALVEQKRVQAWVDGQQSVDYLDDSGLTAGLIGLQFREGEIRFRNIRLRPIGYNVIPKGKRTDWNEPKGDVHVEFKPTGSILLKGGKGQLELLQPHANDCIQVEAKLRDDKTNSGVFYRCIPGDDMNGYESQLHHGFKEDRRRPVDGGPGAIFRRQNARAVLTDADKNAFVTIIADGSFFATWAQGIQVTEWEDTRPLNENPRKGRRLEAGTIMFQGHDPESFVEFFGLSICPLP